MGIINEIGNKYGKLTVIDRAPNDKTGGARWVCKCECGNITEVRGTTLRSGATKSCGCLQKETTRKNGKNLCGQKFGRLTVLEQLPSSKNHRGKYWKCQCECGNVTTARGDQLITGTKQSCGCLQKEKASQNKINEIGNRYGKLTVIEEYPSDSQGHSRWLCRCDCGNTKICYGTRLREGLNSSCGCLHSYGEMKLNNLLTDNNFIFKTQFWFKDLISSKNGVPRFDFAIFNQAGKIICLIEYQGIQHYDENNFFWSEQLKENDNLKSSYCEKNHIPLKYCDDTTNLDQFIQEIQKMVDISSKRG